MTPILRILGGGSNEIGDTFTRLAIDLFHTLGYEDCRSNVHKPGREWDIRGRHVYENRLFLAECKAQKAKIGGSDINKFVGVLDAERRQSSKPINGYFLSISGFKDSAREQEDELGNDRLILLDSSDVITRIESAKIVISSVEAAATASRFMCDAMPQLTISKRPLELLVHSAGWIWAVYFQSQHGEAYACLIHADGHVLNQDSAAIFDLPNTEIITREDSQPPESAANARRIYTEYLQSEYGAITLEGLPAAEDVGSRSFRLESLYVPLNLQVIGLQEEFANAQESDDFEADDESSETAPTISIGDALRTSRRIAILGSPGSGKTTLVKRLAVAYSAGSRLVESEDSLPDITCLPVVIRCRQLVDLTVPSMIDTIRNALIRAELTDIVDPLMLTIGKLLRSGDLLLLIDGLDEIPNTSQRMSFVSQLRTFLARYPRIRIIVTSREVGFRTVAPAVNSVCSPYRTAELNAQDINSLVLSWHREVLGDSSSVTSDAVYLANIINTTDRVRRLAVNPLLLTTLLLVRRWVGQLPRKRTVLYQKAIEVLLMTWNVEGHEPLDVDETLPQLAYAAYRMMVMGVTSVSSRDLAGLFYEARQSLPELLAYAQTPVRTFLSRVEERSSLLILSGHELVDGDLLAVYEFKHLTFQEYLAAQAVVNGWLPEADQQKSLGDLIAPHIKSSQWGEALTLMAVLAGRRGSVIVEAFLKSDLVHPTSLEYPAETDVAIDGVVNCLADDVSITPELAGRAVKFCIERNADPEAFFCRKIKGSKFYDTLRGVAFDGFLNQTGMLEDYGSAISAIVDLDVGPTESPEQTLALIDGLIYSNDETDQIKGSALLMSTAYEIETGTGGGMFLHPGYQLPEASQLTPALKYIAQELIRGQGTRPLTYMQIWAVTWGAHFLPNSPKLMTDLRSKLLEIWRSGEEDSFLRFCIWAFADLPIIGTVNSSSTKNEIDTFLERSWEAKRSTEAHSRKAILIAGLLTGSPWPPEQLIRMAEQSYAGSGHPDQFLVKFKKALDSRISETRVVSKN